MGQEVLSAGKGQLPVVYCPGMDLIFLYGPAAAGKLTIGRALQEKTGICLFHNHLIVNAVVAVFPFGSGEFVRLRHEMWMRVFVEASKIGKSMIFTFTPEGTVSQDFIDELRETWTSAGGRIAFVELQVSEAEQERRIESPDRRAVGKLSSLETLRQIRAKGKPHGLRIPADLIVNTESLTPVAAADLIVSRFKIPASDPYNPFPDN